MRYSSAILLLLAGLAAPSSRPVESPETLLDQLASPDAQTRALAADKLISWGVEARPVVLEATHSPNPEVRARAAELILKLPWIKPGDPGEVQRVLSVYGQHEPGGRIHDTSVLANLPNRAGVPALVRLLVEEPSDAVRWTVVAELHSADASREALAPLRQIDPADQPAPVLAGMALAHAATDQTRSRQLYQQASDALLRDASAPVQHLVYADILAEHGLRSLARKEYETALSLPGTHPPLFDANAHFQLASLIGDSDDRASADHLKAGIEAFTRAEGAGLTIDRGGNRITGNDAMTDLRAQMHFRYYRADAKANDSKSAEGHLNQLLAMKPSRDEVVLEIVPALKQLGRVEDAKTMFERAYKPRRAMADSDPSNAEALNNLAWLCARCDEHLEEAVRLATEAVRIAPDNAAYLDTAAEAHFHLGHREQAVALESKAIQLRPGDEFMQAQLKRFQAAATRPAR